MKYPDSSSREDLLLLINRNYCVRAHLAERLPELTGNGMLLEQLDLTFEELTLELERELTALDQLLNDLNVNWSSGKCSTLVDYLEDLFTAASLLSSFKNRELALRYYVNNAERILSLTEEMIRAINEEHDHNFDGIVFYNPNTFKACRKYLYALKE